MMEFLSSIWSWVLNALGIVLAWAFVLIVLGGALYAMFKYIRPENSTGGRLDGIEQELRQLNKKKDQEKK